MLYSSKNKVKSGVPLGGVGTGKIEILPNGCLDYITFLNNWRQPIFNTKNNEENYAKGLMGFHFGVFVKYKEKSYIKILQTEELTNYSTIDEIEYTGTYPKATLIYKDKELPLKIELNAFSPIIPNNYNESSVPGAIFEFNVTNNEEDSLEVTLFMIARNIIGKWYIGRTNRLKEFSENKVGINFIQEPAYINDPTHGEYSIMLETKNKIGYMNSWNSQLKNFVYDKDTISLELVDYLKKHNQVPKQDIIRNTANENIQLASAFCDTFSLKQAESQTTTFTLGWYFPKHQYGHYYEKKFKSSFEVCSFLQDNKDSLKKQTDTWHESIDKTEMPGWLKDALINNLYILTTGTWLTKKGDFTLYESPGICPLMGTLDVGFYATLPVALLFPEWEKSYLTLFADVQREDGYVPHDLGFECLDMPSDGTTMLKWKDINSKFILMLYRDFLWTKDENYLKKIYPKAKKALEWLQKYSVKDHDLPENDGADQTFDTWDFFGVNSYTAGLYLAALLAMEKMADIFQEKKFAKECRVNFEKGKISYEKLLWSGEYFYTANDGKNIYDSCTVGQILGQWYAHLLGLGYIFDKDKIRSALLAIDRLNNKDSKFGCTNSVFPCGKRDNKFIHSRNYWPTMIYAYSSLCIYEGLTKQGLETSEKIWSTFADVIKSPWNQADCINPDDGTYTFGDYYMRNMGIWSIAFALAQEHEDVKEMIDALKMQKI